MLYDRMLYEKQQLINRINLNKEKLKTLPEGTLYCVNQKWYYKVKGKKERYLPKKNEVFAAKLAYKRFLIAQNKDLERKIQAVNAYLEKCPKESNSEKLLMQNDYKQLIHKFILPMNDWASAHFNQNPLCPEGRIHPVCPGVAVRSKSEALIASRLLMHKIPFRYECALPIRGKLYYPDFTLLHPDTGKIFYWEHLGLLDDAAYTEHAAQKMQLYAQVNIYLNKNLILTSEGVQNPLTIPEIEKTILYIIQ